METIKTLEVKDWDAILTKKQFWYEYFNLSIPGKFFFEYFGISEDAYYDESDEILDVVLEWPLPEGYKLCISISISHAYEADLYLLLPQNNDSNNNNEQPREFELGWDDGGHWHPDTFRWEEMQAILKCLEKTQVDHSICDLKFVPLLLRKFTPATKENSDFVFQQTREFFRQTGLFTDLEIEELVGLRTYIHEDFRWIYSTERGWVAMGKDGYSLRLYDPEYENEFNFAVFRQFMHVIFNEAGLDSPV